MIGSDVLTLYPRLLFTNNLRGYSSPSPGRGAVSLIYNCDNQGRGQVSKNLPFKTAINKMTRIRDEYKPNPKNRDVYKKLYNQVYKKMYKRLEPLYHEIRHITDYPKKVI